ncbi:MAG: GrpB family protein [Clostridiales bacterium]|nr:GrpB family protein [Clostridiales bacterium]
MIGLKRGTVQLCEHEKGWEIEAQNTIVRLKNILGDVIKDIQHVGSTSILTIKAKPIIDIAVAVDKFDDILAYEKELKDAGFYYRPKSDLGAQLLFASGSLYEGTGDLQTHFIHVVQTNSMDWINYINFRDYLNKTPSVAKEYEDLKVSLALQAPIDSGREKYLKGKHDFIVYTLRKALVKSYLGKTVTISIDRPVGSVHPKHHDIIYPINYGYIPKVFGGDGEELDVYLLGVDIPVSEFTGKIIGIVHRHNDVEDKLVMAPEEMSFTAEEIADGVRFQEQYYDSEIESMEDLK